MESSWPSDHADYHAAVVSDLVVPRDGARDDRRLCGWRLRLARKQPPSAAARARGRDRPAQAGRGCAAAEPRGDPRSGGQLISAQEEERRRIALDLHDDINQQLAALSTALSSLKGRLAGTGDGVGDQLSQIQQRTAALTDDVRNLSHTLHPAVLEHVGLAAALRAYCAEYSEQSGVSVELEVDEHLGEVPAEMALGLYRITQEALRNVARHSGASQAEVALICDDEAIQVRFADLGSGFDVQRARQGGGLGLTSMGERVRLLHGNLRVTTEIGHGTEILVHVPLAEQAESQMRDPDEPAADGTAG